MTSEILLRVLMGLGTLGIAWAGWLLNKRAQRDTREATAAANVLQTRVNTVDELESVIAHLKDERDHIAAEKDRLAETNSTLVDRQAARCQAQLDALIDSLATLQSIVQDEIARAAAQVTVREAQAHEASDHGRSWDIDETRY